MGDWLVRTGEKEFMFVLPETDRKGAQCVVRKLDEAFAESAPIEGPFGGAIRISVTTMDPNSEDGAAHMQALLAKAESYRYRDNHDAKRAPDAGMYYLTDFVLGRDADNGRNWPAT
jgi:GGDEF domain-containing protein